MPSVGIKLGPPSAAPRPSWLIKSTRAREGAPSPGGRPKPSGSMQPPSLKGAGPRLPSGKHCHRHFNCSLVSLPPLELLAPGQRRKSRPESAAAGEPSGGQVQPRPCCAPSGGGQASLGCALSVNLRVQNKALTGTSPQGLENRGILSRPALVPSQGLGKGQRFFHLPRRRSQRVG